MPYKEKSMKSLRQKQRRDEAPVKVKPLGEAPKVITHGTKTIYVTAEKAAKLLMACNALDKQMQGLQGKESLLDMVRYGVHGPTMSSVKVSLGG